MEDDIPKYRKKRKHETPSKSKHKHEYEKVILRYKNKRGYNYISGLACSICGKVGDAYFFEADENNRHMWSEDVLEKYKGCKIIDWSW